MKILKMTIMLITVTTTVNCHLLCLSQLTAATLECSSSSHRFSSPPPDDDVNEDNDSVNDSNNRAWNC